MNILRRWTPRCLRLRPLTPIQFPTKGFPVISDASIVEEERYPTFRKDKYFPVHLGDVLGDKYQVLGKLGFGRASTVWLGRSLDTWDYVVLKVYTHAYTDFMGHTEINIHKIVSRRQPDHVGHKHLRKATEMIDLSHEGNKHYCLVQQPLWDSLQDMLRYTGQDRFELNLIKPAMYHLLQALDYFHATCKLVHTDITAANMFSEFEDASILDDYVEDQLRDPVPRKVTATRTTYVSRYMRKPRGFGTFVLGDFGATVAGEQEVDILVQPTFYRSPEVLLKANWGYPIDIWNVGVLLWHIYEGRLLFRAIDPSKERHTVRAHLAEIVALLGPPPPDLLKRGSNSGRYFTEDGAWKGDYPIPPRTSLEEQVTRLRGGEKSLFIDFIGSMLQWRPEDRKTAKELSEHPWLCSKNDEDVVKSS